MPLLQEQLTDAEVLVALTPEELATPLLLHLIQVSESAISGRLHPTNNLLPIALHYGRHWQERVGRALGEAWAVLINDGLLVADIEQPDWRVISRKGMSLRSREQILQFRMAAQLPRGLLHSSIADRSWSSILRGEYDTAVFQAFREVEVAVRAAAELSTRDIGVNLMRRAFHPESGPLTDRASDPAERQATQELFSGGIGRFKNPHSHRNVPLTDAEEAFQMLMLASMLLRIVDARQQGASGA